MPAITRKPDQRKRNTPFIRTAERIDKHWAFSHPMQVVTNAHASTIGNQRAWRSFDSHDGVVLVTNLSDLPTTRRTAERILGVPVQTIHADTVGTVYTPKGL